VFSCPLSLSLLQMFPKSVFSRIETDTCYILGFFILTCEFTLVTSLRSQDTLFSWLVDRKRKH